jgi:hypothetical protein
MRASGAATAGAGRAALQIAVKPGCRPRVALGLLAVALQQRWRARRAPPQRVR